MKGEEVRVRGLGLGVGIVGFGFDFSIVVFRVLMARVIASQIGSQIGSMVRGIKVHGKGHIGSVSIRFLDRDLGLLFDSSEQIFEANRNEIFKSQ